MSARLRFPTTLLEMQRLFPDEKAAAAYLRLVRWPEGFAWNRRPRIVHHGLGRMELDCHGRPQTIIGGEASDGGRQLAAI
jgi:hypothetical protein